MINKKNGFILFVMAFLLLSVNWSLLRAESIVISGKLKKLNRSTHIVGGKDGNAVAIWNYNKANNATYGRIYLVELNRQEDGTWEAEDPLLVFKGGQRPSVVYLPNFDHYLIACDTGLTKITDYLKAQKPTKILCRRYSPTYRDNKRDAASSLSKIFTLVDNGTIAINAALNYLEFAHGYERCFFSYSEAQITASGNKVLRDFEKPVSGFGLRGNIVDLYKKETYWMHVSFNKGAYFSSGGATYNGFLFLGGMKIYGCQNRVTYSGIFRINTTTWAIVEIKIGSTPGTFFGATYPLSINSYMAFATNVYQENHNNVYGEDHKWITGLFNQKGQIKNTFDFPKKDIIGNNVDWFKTNLSNSPLDNAKNSDIYLVYAQTNGRVWYSNVSLKGKPGKATRLFKAKQNKFWNMDVTYMKDEALMVYSEFTNNKKTKSAVKFTTFEVK